jgi:hypothetical protein
MTVSMARLWRAGQILVMGKRSGRKRFESKAEREARRAEEERSRALAPGSGGDRTPDVPRDALVSRLPKRGGRGSVTGG